MNIDLQNTGNLTAKLKVKIEPDDYKDNVDTELKGLQKKAQVRGFRPGKAPMGLVKKMYLKSVMAEQVNTLLSKSLYEYIEKENLNILGNPLPDKDMGTDIDFETQTEFEFSFDVGMAPEINLELDENTEVEYFKIKVDDSMLDETIENLKKQNGEQKEMEVVEAEDVLKGQIQEIDGDGNIIDEGLSHETTISVNYVQDKETKERFIGSKKNDTIDLDIEKTAENETEMASMLGVNKEDLDQYGKNYRFTINQITRLIPAEMNKEFYDKVVAENSFETEEDFREHIRGELGKNLQGESDRNFANDAKQEIIEKTNLELPEEFLKKWLLENNSENENFTKEQVETDFVKYKDSFKWQLIQSHLIKKYDLKVEQDEVRNHISGMVTQQFMQYGYNQFPDSFLDEYVNKMMEDKEQLRSVYDQIYDQKITGLMKEKLKLKETEIGYNDFINKMTEKQQQGASTNPSAIEEEKKESEEKKVKTESESNDNQELK